MDVALLEERQGGEKKTGIADRFFVIHGYRFTMKQGPD